MDGRYTRTFWQVCFILFHSVEDPSASASAKNTLTSLLLTKQTLQMADMKENACYAVLMQNHLEFMTKTIYFGQ